MSEFDENPFGEPTVNDPFADPAVRRAAAATPANRGIEDYNPFAEPSSQGATQVRGAANPPIYGGIGATPLPATLQPTTQEIPPPAYARSPQQTVPTPNLGSTLSPSSEQRAEEEWKASRESELRNTSYYPGPNNWPPLPEKCCFQPCFYQDIDVDINPNFQKIVRQLYYLWMFHSLVLILNVVGGFALMLCFEEFSTFGLGILYVILFTPFSFVCWFRPAYKAFNFFIGLSLLLLGLQPYNWCLRAAVCITKWIWSDSSINFMVFFFVFFFQLVVTSIQAIGIPGSGTCGIIKAITTFDGTGKGTVVGILILMIAVCYCVTAGGDLLLLTKIHRMYRTSSASVSKAQQEFATTFLRNEHVQNAAGNVAASAVRNQMANATQPRY